MTNVIEVLDGGLLTTVQDTGRYSYQRYGVPVAGVMDPYSAGLANALLGNHEHAAVLEMTLVGPKLMFLENSAFVLGGANLGARLDGESIGMWEVIWAKSGNILSFDGPTVGVRTYLAVPGGLDVPEVMGSRSTYVRAQIGGVQGRSLVKGDLLLCDLDSVESQKPGIRIPESLLPMISHEQIIRIVMGPQTSSFTAQGVATFLSSSYQVSQQSDRVGCRLEGPVIEHVDGADIISDGIPFGGIQVTGDGLPVILMADRGVTGGYAKIGTVASVDLWKVAQALTGDVFSFKAISPKDAQTSLIERKKELSKLQAEFDKIDNKQFQLPRVTLGHETFEVFSDDGEPLTREEVSGVLKKEVHKVVASVNGRDYTFELGIERIT